MIEPWTAPDGTVFQPNREGYSALMDWFDTLEHMDVDMPQEWLADVRAMLTAETYFKENGSPSDLVHEGGDVFVAARNIKAGETVRLSVEEYRKLRNHYER